MNTPLDYSLTRRSFLRAALIAGLSGAALLTGCSTQSKTASETASGSESVEEGTKILVAFYSASGNTRAVAEEIAQELNADLFEITPRDPYTVDDLDWTVDDSRVNIEHEDESKRSVSLVQVTPDEFDRYDTVLIGYPIWWAIAAWPVDGFVEGNDFTGKTIIPFCTSTSSGLGNSATNLAHAADSGNWEDGMRFASHPREEEVREWVESLDL